MPSSNRLLSTRHLTVAAACTAALVIGVPSAAAAPATDGRGFVDSTARCDAPNTASAFGRTATSRVAICRIADGGYEYRGVRVRDGARLIVAATRSNDGQFIAENDGITYTVTASSLTVTANKEVIREEQMLDFQAPDASKPLSSPTSAVTPTPTPTTPLPPPLPAEVGGSGR
jgi:hypothetical protein